jgi:hypothetical protein
MNRDDCDPSAHDTGIFFSGERTGYAKCWQTAVHEQALDWRTTVSPASIRRRNADRAVRVLALSLLGIVIAGDALVMLWPAPVDRLPDGSLQGLSAEFLQSVSRPDPTDRLANPNGGLLGAVLVIGLRRPRERPRRR